MNLGDLDDKDLFRDAMGDVKPLEECASVHWLKSPSLVVSSVKTPQDQTENFLVEGFLDVLPLSEPLEFKAEGIQQGVLDKLRLGKYELDASLNLLRQPIKNCRQLLFTFMLQARKDNLRNLLIIHGKGRHDKSHANIIRSHLNRWLRQFDDVQTFCIAQSWHGGSGAIYVGMRKTEQARQDNRERHAKRSR
nr:DNA endonuclease SmrA [Pantoea sp. 201603H]